MDGTFVEPITFGGQMVKNIRPLTKLPLDVHLMIEHPKTQIKFFAEEGADIITVHYEACKKISDWYLKETLELIKSYGVKCGVVVNPDTDVSKVFDVFPLCDMVLIMSVFPGYGGQKFIPTALGQLKKAREYAASIGKADMDIEIDGGVTVENVADIKAAGANVIVAGSTVFKAKDMAATIAALKA
jgi:ribulose-phosphate 3-epimerase